MVRRSTDLPVPEPPTIPMTSPRATSSSSPSWMTLAPNWVRKPRIRITSRAGSGAADMRYIPNIAKRIENMASSTITRKMASTTARVVMRPTDSALPDTRMPS